jgi:hypothetical protein
MEAVILQIMITMVKGRKLEQLPSLGFSGPLIMP